MSHYSKKKNSYAIKIVIFILYLMLIYFGLYNKDAVRIDNYERLVSFPGKTKVECPTQKQGTGVLLVIGQSNSANYAEKIYATELPDKVFNYFNGRCYVASSPLLGASGIYGEFITPLADKLIKEGVYKNVIIVPAGVGGTPISRWKAGGDLNNMLLNILKGLEASYRVTDIIWQQGEADFLLGTSADEYLRSFHSLVDSLGNSIANANIFISISTKCGTDSTWHVNNPVARGQKALIDNKQIFLGADTDVLLDRQDRRVEDDCHLSQSGQEKTARAYANSIRKARRALW